jgi:outer membrane protein OmpA-like peptidoglycan-associated protein
MVHSHAPATSRQAGPAARPASPGHGPTQAARRAAPGNQAAQRLLQGGVLQAKLNVSQPGDPFEREADAVADQVMGSGTPRVQRMCAACREQAEEPLAIRRQCTHCGAHPGATPETEAAIGKLNGGGRPLPDAARSFFEARFGRDFGGVRVHTGSSASQAAQAVNALAFTTGNNIVFAPGQYAPDTEQGQRLLAHELAHTIQQGQGGAQALQRAACPPTPTGIGGSAPSPDCAAGAGATGGAIFRFCLDSDLMDDPSEHLLPLYVPVLSQLDTVEVHGYASSDGPQGREDAYNLNLSCKRANRAADMLAALGVARSRIRTVKHGATTAFGPPEANRAVVIPVPHVHRIRVAAVSMLACAPCNPFTDDGMAAVTPPVSESAIATLRQKHSIEATVFSFDGRRFAPGSPGITAARVELGDSGYCGNLYPPARVSRSAPGAGRSVLSPLHGEGLEWESELSSRVGAVVPCTLLDPLGMMPGAPCGNLGTSPMVPAIGNRFFLRLFADGTAETGFLSASAFPFHYLYTNGSLQTAGGAPVSPVVDFASWATSTGVAQAQALAGFKALRQACCTGTVGCPCVCRGGETVLRPAASLRERVENRAACAAAAVGFMTGSCSTGCGPVGTPCSVHNRPANP